MVGGLYAGGEIGTADRLNGVLDEARACRSGVLDRPVEADNPESASPEGVR
jgi:hypothetical protein